MPSLSLLQRLKERKLVQWAVAYLAGAWVIYEATGTALEAWNIPVLLVQAIHILLIIGFFITLVLAWYHGEKGRQRVSGPELLMVAALMVVAGVALSVLPGGDGGSHQNGTAITVEMDDEKPSIAVLPLDNFSPDPNDAYFADGVHEEIISRLSKVASLRVISRNSVMRYREERKLTRQVATELGVGFILEGSARIGGGMVRLTLQLIDGNTDEHIWSEEYDRPYAVEDFIPIQSEIAQEIARTLQVEIAPGEQALIAAVPTDNTEAYNAYLEGLFWSNRRDQDGLNRGVELFQSAVETDSLFALAFAGLAEAYALFPWYGDTSISTAEAHARASAAAKKALELDGRLAEGYTALASVKMWFEWDWDSAEEAFLQAIALNPNFALAHSRYAWSLACWGRFEDAERRAYAALELDPLSESGRRNVGTVLYYGRRYDEAGEQLEANLEMYPESDATRDILAKVYFYQGMHEEAIDVRPGSVDAVRSLHALGLEAEATSLANRLLGERPEETDLGTRFSVRMALGEVETAFESFFEAYQQKSPWVVAVVSPTFDPLRSDPRFIEILRELDLEGLEHLGGN